MILIYYFTMNMLGFLSMGIDKRKAIHRHNRISERTLFIFIWMGGMLGSYFGMHLFHHKTRKRSFSNAILGSCLLHGICWLYLIGKYIE